MKTNELEMNIEMAKLQQRIDDLTNLSHYAEKYKADNRQMIAYDLQKAMEKMSSLKGE